MSVLKGLSVVSVNVSNWEGAKKFYQETLGLPISFDTGPEVGWCEFGETGKTTFAINLSRDGEHVHGDGGATAIFAVDDCAKAVVELRKRGVKVDDPVTIPGMVSYANLYDPEGNRLQMAQSLAG